LQSNEQSVIIKLEDPEAQVRGLTVSIVVVCSALLFSCGGPVIPSDELYEIFLATQKLDLIKEVTINNYSITSDTLSSTRGVNYLPFMKNRPYGVLVVPNVSSTSTSDSGSRYKAFLLEEGEKQVSINYSMVSSNYDILQKMRNGWGFTEPGPVPQVQQQEMVNVHYSAISPTGRMVSYAYRQNFSYAVRAIGSSTDNIPVCPSSTGGGSIPEFKNYTPYAQQTNIIPVATSTPSPIFMGFTPLSGKTTDISNTQQDFVSGIHYVDNRIDNFRAYSLLSSVPPVFFPIINPFSASSADQMAMTRGYLATQTDNGGNHIDSDFAYSYYKTTTTTSKLIFQNGLFFQVDGNIELHRIGPPGAGQTALEMRTDGYYSKGEKIATRAFNFVTWYADGNDQYAIFSLVIPQSTGTISGTAVEGSNSGSVVVRCYAYKY